MVTELSKDITKYWGFNGKVGEWDYLIDLNESLSISEIRFRYFDWLSSVLDKLVGLHSVLKLEFNIVDFDDQGVEINYEEAVDYKIDEEFSLSDFLTFLNNNYQNFYLTNLNFELSTRIVTVENDFVIDNSAELMFCFDSDVSYFLKKTEFTVTYTTYIDVWFMKTINSDRNLIENKRFHKENTERLNQLLNSFSGINNATCYSYESDHYFSFLDKNSVRIE